MATARPISKATMDATRAELVAGTDRANDVSIDAERLPAQCRDNGRTPTDVLYATRPSRHGN